MVEVQGVRPMADFRLLIVPAEGNPHFAQARDNRSLIFEFRSAAIVEGQKIINKGEAKVVIVYRGKKPTQLLTYRPQDYVHIERI